ncbi:MAG: N-acetylneuraminate synthase [Elusimicrobia bacterium]|nr:N-acetylneuraminate synthase [Elusimicrobiota bacterium]
MKPNDTFRFAGRTLAPGRPVFIAAEIGINHNGSERLARRMIDAAVRCGVDGVKFQTFSTERLVSGQAQKAAYQKANVKGGSDQYGWLKPLELDEASHRRLKAYAEGKGLVFFSTPFDAGCVPLLERLRVPVYKIASGNVTDEPLLRRVGRTGKPVILSVGMSTEEEVRDALGWLKKAGSGPVMLLHCTSNYPTAHENIHLKTLEVLRETFRLPVGFSDHSTDNYASFASVTLGACFIERHFTLDRSLAGADHKASLEPEQLADLVKGVRTVEKVLGEARKRILPCEREIKKALQKSLVAARPIRRGEVFRADMLSVKRPGTGLPPKEIGRVIGKKALRDIEFDQVITQALVGR